MTDLARLSIAVDSTSARTATKDLDALSLVGDKVAGAAKGLAAAWAAWSLGKHITEVTALAARYDTMNVVMGVAGANAGYSRVEMALLEEELKNTGISAMQSRNSLTNLATANINLADATKLARAAQDVAVVGNINSSESLERMIRGIKSGEVEILRTMGLNVQFEEGYKQTAKTLGKNTEQLTALEKQQSRVSQVLGESAKYAGIYEASMGTAGKQMKSMERYAEDLQVKMGGVFQPALVEIVSVLTTSLKGANAWLDKNSISSMSLGDSFRATVAATSDLIGTLGGLVGGADSAADALGALQHVVDGIGLGISVLADGIRLAVGELKVLAGTLSGGMFGNLFGGNDMYREGLSNLNEDSVMGRFLDRKMDAQGNLISRAAVAEQVRSYKEVVEERTRAYDRFASALAKIANPSEADKSLLATLGILRDSATAELQRIQKGLPEEYGPNFGQGTKPESADAAALAKEYKRQADFVRDLAREMEALGKSERDLLILRVQQANLNPGMEAAALAIANQLAGKKALLEVEKELAKLKPPTDEAYVAPAPIDPRFERQMKAQRDAKQYADDLNDRYMDRTTRMEAEVLKLNGALVKGSISLQVYQERMRDLRYEGSDTWKLIEDSAVMASDAIGDAFAKMVLGTKVAFKDLTASILADIARMTAQRGFQQLMNFALTTWMGGGAPAPESAPSIKLVGALPDTGPVGGYGVPAGMPAGSAAPAVTINITTHQGGGTSTESGGNGPAWAPELAKGVEALVKQTLAKEQRLTGSLRPVFGGA